jgi:colanic acid biosynthesis glycosyl transferase WcaI
MHILVISQYFYPENFKINDLVKALKERGYQITVITGIPNYPSGKWYNGYGLRSSGHEYYEGMRIIRMPIFPRMNGKSWQLIFNYMSFAISASLLGPFLCREKYDLVFVFEPSPFTVGIPGIVMKKHKNIPMIFWVQDLWPESLTATGAIRSRWILWLVERMVRFIYKHSDRILVQSEAFIEPAIKVGADRSRIRYFPNWAESIYKPLDNSQEAIESRDLPDGFRIMFAGNLGSAQSLETILGAAQRLKRYEDIHWIIIGDGRKMLWMKQQVNYMGISRQVHFMGQHDVNTMPRFFSLADGLLVTLRSSPVFSFTVPSKVQSYLACGRPIIASLDGEGARIIKNSGSGGFRIKIT